jgi:hypothetical protein
MVTHRRAFGNSEQLSEIPENHQTFVAGLLCAGVGGAAGAPAQVDTSRLWHEPEQLPAILEIRGISAAGRSVRWGGGPAGAPACVGVGGAAGAQRSKPARTSEMSARKIARNSGNSLNFRSGLVGAPGASRAAGPAFLSDNRGSAVISTWRPSTPPSSPPIPPPAPRFAGTDSHGPMDPPKISLTAKG